MQFLTPIAPPTTARGTPCPVCQQPSRLLFRKYDYAIQGCTVCTHRFMPHPPEPEHVTQVYDDRYFCGGEAGYPDYLAEAKLLRRHGRRYGRMLQHRGIRPGTLLDVGAAAGFVLQGFEEMGWRGQGIEPNDRMAEYGRSQLQLPIQTGPLESLEPHAQFDLVTMIQVVAHFYDLRRAFQIASDATKPGGHWLIETWNRNSLTARLLGPGWHEYSPPSVLHWFAPQDLALLAQQFGFEGIARGRPIKRISGAHAKSLLRYKLLESPWGKLPAKLLNWVPDGLEIPYPAEDLFWALYRKKSA
ncbi:MAG: class I SAM-dependent methyltransferase [Synechococcales cyanobacterium RU_4_20]|nr:class I SAM-dependent methyltransferase [Synechococcales cyanobacterium RU_4_20]NJR69144.1 class I SAM-dependent methyltransferase [Synechococcales cyanobacterium CRU_2_2]